MNFSANTVFKTSSHDKILCSRNCDFVSNMITDAIAF